MRRVYLDHAATTYLDHRVKKVMDKYWIENFGNPSAFYFEGRSAKKAIADSRKRIADAIGARPDEIIFTSGGTEANNLAILGIANSKSHIITTKIEHHSVLNPIKFLETQGARVVYINVGEDGIVNLKDFKKALRPETKLVSIIYANNEIGTIQPIVEIAKILKNHKAVFHIDACQATGHLEMDVKKLGVDLMTVNGSKIYGPKGIGFLYVKKGIKINPLMHGGEQEFKLRPGTENVPAIVGLAEAIVLAKKEKNKEAKRLTGLRDYFIARLIKEIPKTFLNGHPKNRLPNNINVSILGVEGEAIVLYLDELGISCSTGSACSSESLDPSHVIMAIRNSHEFGHGSIRFSLGKRNTKKDIDYVMKVLPDVVKKLRSISTIKI